MTGSTKHTEQDHRSGLERATEQAEHLGTVVRRLEEIREVARAAKDEMTLVDIAHLVSGSRDLADRIIDREHGSLAYLSPYAPEQEEPPATA